MKSKHKHSWEKIDNEIMICRICGKILIKGKQGNLKEYFGKLKIWREK